MLLFVVTLQEVVFPPSGGKEQKISLNLSQFVPPPAPKPVLIPPQPSEQSDNPTETRTKPIVTPPIPQPIVKKDIEPKPEVQPIKKKVLDESKKIFAEKSTEENNVTKVEPKPKKKVVKKEVKKEKTKKRIVKRTKTRKVQKIKKQRRSKDPLANALMGSGTSMFPASRPSSSASYVTKMIKQLYGKEFNTFSPSQKKFIKNNLGTIHYITQRTLTQNGYPDVAVRTKQQGTNVVSFYLHPNGNITGLRLKRRIGYEALDQNTLHVIRIAYKDYPRPKTKTKITFYVKYSIY